MKKNITIIAVILCSFLINPTFTHASTSSSDFVCDKVVADGDLVKCQLRLSKSNDNVKVQNIKGTFSFGSSFQLDHIEKNSYIKNINSDGYNFDYDLNTAYIDNNAVLTAYFKTNLNNNYSIDSDKISISYQTKNLVKSDTSQKKTATSTQNISQTIIFDKNQENKLLLLSLQGHNLNSVFDPNTLYYESTTQNDHIILNGVLKSDKSTSNINLVNNKIPLEYGANGINITITSANNNTRTYSLVVTREPSLLNSPKLSTLTIAERSIIIMPGIYSYNITVPYDIEVPNISYIPDSTNTKVVVQGEKKLKVGTNTYNIKLTNDEGNNTNYVIIINREAKVLSNNSSIKNIGIKNIEFKFNKEKKNYNLQIPYFQNKLDFEIMLSDNKAKYKVLNNNNLKDSSVITIRVTAEDGSTTDYKITVTKEFPVYIVSIIIFFIILALIIIILIIRNHYKNRNIVKIV